jgi:hypothetical protein
MGTVLAFTVNTLQRELWGDDLAFAYVHNRDFNILQQERARLVEGQAARCRPTAKLSYDVPADAPEAPFGGHGDDPSEDIPSAMQAPQSTGAADGALGDELFSEGGDPSLAEMARVHDIFLDYLAYLCTSSSPYLMVSRFDSLLSDPERKLKQALQGFVMDLSANNPDAMLAPEWAEVQRMLEGLGGANTLLLARAQMPRLDTKGKK